jgi:hypothetical protein
VCVWPRRGGVVYGVSRLVSVNDRTTKLTHFALRQERRDPCGLQDWRDMIEFMAPGQEQPATADTALFAQ